MKKSSFLFVIAATLILFASCQKEQMLIPVPVDSTLTKPSATQATILDIAISNAACYAEGETLYVVRPNANDKNFYTSPAYKVEWIVEGGLFAEGNHVNCVCGKTLTVVVTDQNSGETASLEYKAMDCNGQ